MKHFSVRSVVALTAMAGLLPQMSAQHRSVTDASGGCHPLVGGVIKPKDNSFKGGIYTIPSDGTTSMTLGVADIKPNGGGVLAGGKYYSMSYRLGFWGDLNVTYKVFDATTWDCEKTQSFSNDWSAVAMDMAYDTTDGKVYGCFYTKDGKGFVFGTLDLDDRTRTEITTIASDNPWYGVASAPDGTLYAIDKSGKLMTVNKTTGATVTIGNTGLAATEIASAAIDPKNGRMYYSRYNSSESAIYEINRTTAEATLVAGFDGCQFFGLNVPPVAAEAGAPAPVTNLTASFPGGSLEGTLAFDAPVTTTDGNPASGEITYSVSINGVESLTGTTQYGASVTLPVTVSVAGNYEFTVTVSQDGESSAATSVSSWAGNDVPKSPADVVMKLEGSTVRLSWTPVSDGIHDGYVNPGEVTYTIVRYPGAVQVASGHSGSQFSEPLAEPSEGFVDYYYTVAASYAGAVSDPAESNHLVVGAVITPPYLNNFDTESQLDGFTRLNLQDPTGEINWTWDSYRKCVSMRWTPYKKMDAWLISPRVRLEAGKIYSFSFDASGDGDSYVERVEAYLGSEPTPDAMKTHLLGPVELTNPVYAMVTLSGEITVPETGIYYIGVHGCSDMDMYRLRVDNLTIGAGARISAPAAPENLKAVPDPDHLAKATVSLTAPRTDIDGKSLESITKIELSRDGEVIETFTAPTPGDELSFTDETVTEGNHTYSAVAFNAGGAGKVATATVYVGVALPTAPVNASACETSVPGEVTVSWEAPLFDINGNPLKPEQVTYTIRNFNDNTLVAEGISGLSYTWQAETDRQTFRRYKVFASTEKGMCDEYASTARIPVGPAFTLPVNESFAGVRFLNEELIKDNSIWATKSPTGSHAVWQIYSDGADLSAQDGDNAFSGSYSEYQFDEIMLYSGKIDLAGAVNPALVFYYWVFYPDCGNVIEVKVNSGKGFETVTYLATGGDATGWSEVIVPLEAYAGKTVQIGFSTKTVDYSHVVIDNISVKDIKRHNLTAAGIRVPSKMHGGRQEAITVRVENSGLQEAAGYTVDLYCNDEKVQSAEGPALDTGERTDVEFIVTPSVAEARTLRYHAVVNYEEDEDPDDNISESRTATLVLPLYPAVTDLNATRASGDIVLDWSVPAIENAMFQSITDDFESYGQFVSNTAGKWSFIDGDGSATHGFGDALVFPGMEMPMAYTVFNNTGITTTNMFDAHSGHQYMASFAATSGQNDDWMISPELKGVRQAVTFWAKTYAGNYGNEEFEFLYSTTGKAREDFIKIGEDHNVPVDWTEYEYILPEGARYFAIRCVSHNRFIFFVDDVTYIPAGAAPMKLEILGYNVYRDGVKLNDAPLSVPGYTDRQPEAKSYTYGVSTVYDAGESALSNLVSITASVDAPAGEYGVTVTSDGVSIIVAGAAGLDVSVNDMSGRLLYHDASAPDSLAIPVQPGVYVVKAGNSAVKIIVK